MANETEIQQQIIQHLQGIPLFHRLSGEELGKIYAVCTFRRLAADEQLYTFGTPSDDLFILLDGQLVARTTLCACDRHGTRDGVFDFQRQSDQSVSPRRKHLPKNLT